MNKQRILIKAESGVAEAQYRLGCMYEKGDGVARNDAEAVKWIKFAANQGLAKAQSKLGLKYLEGEGVPQNYSEAVTWFRKAAEQGIAKAQYNLGLMYENGKGVPKDDVEAVKWYLKAKEVMVKKQKSGSWLAIILPILVCIPANIFMVAFLVMTYDSGPGPGDHVIEKLLEAGCFIVPSFMLISIVTMIIRKEKIAQFFAAATIIWPVFLFVVRLSFLFQTAHLIKNEILFAETSIGRLVFSEEIDEYGRNCKNNLYLISNHRKDEIELSDELIYQEPEIAILLKDRPSNDTNKRINGLTLFIDPKVFTMQEYKIIGTAISKNIGMIDLRLSFKREPLEFFDGNIGRQPHITRICYLDRKSLNREYHCTDGTTIKVYSNGASSVFFSKEAKRTNGAKLKDYFLGNLKKNGRHMYVYHSIENFNVTKGQNKLTMFDTVIENCYDSENRNFFNEYTFEQQILKNSN